MDNGYSLSAALAYIQDWKIALHDVVTSIILAIIIIVVAVPEGLPMMIAIVLSMNMRKLLNKQVLVRKLLGIETAGSINLLFADKTGTLTLGTFEPRLFLTGNLEKFDSFDEIPSTLKKQYVFAVQESTSARLTANKTFIGGNASDRALLRFAPTELITQNSDVSIEDEILFNSERKFSATRLKLRGKSGELLGAGDSLSIVKGAPEILFAKANSYYDSKGTRVKCTSFHALSEELNRLSAKGLRFIAVGTSPLPLVDNKVPGDITLVGVVGLYDKVRSESRQAVESAQAAGIQVIMITGDREGTAVHVAEEVGLLTSGKASLVLTSEKLNAMLDSEIASKLDQISVIARARPTDKSRLVRIAQSVEKVVGMTGDGVNDSSALKKADVGFAMGSGAEVSKEAADIVILDDNFASITQAVLYGRTIYKSIQKFIVFQSTVNVASTLIVFIGPFMGFDFPLTLTQLLWVNLVMDTLAALAFGGEAALKRYMKERPIPRKAAIVNTDMWSSFIVNGTFIAIMSIIFLTWDPILFFFSRGCHVNDAIAVDEPCLTFLTAFFAFFIFLTNFNAFNVRVTGINLFNHLFDNKGFVIVVAIIFIVQISFSFIGGKWLRTVGLELNEWMVLIFSSAIIIPFDIIRKTVMKTFFSRQAQLKKGE